MSHDKKLKVTVHYAPAAKPYKQDAERTETVGQLLAAVMTAFEITPDPKYKYVLYHGSTALTDMSITLGAVAGEKEDLQFKLSQELIQGGRHGRRPL